MRSKAIIASMAFALSITGSLLAQAGSNPPQTSPGKPATAGKAVPNSYKRVLKRPLPPFKPQQPTRLQLANGMVIFLQEDHELPFINGVVRIRGGGRDSSAAKAGLVDIYGDAWRTGGTTNKTGDQLDEYLEARAASVETDGGTDSTTVSFSSLKSDFDGVFEVFKDLLHHPEFREDKVSLSKLQYKSAVSRRNDDIGGIASREAAKLGYGADNPYVRQAEYWTIDSVTRQDLLDWHKKYVHPNNIILGLAGDFDTKQMEAKLRQSFESWKKGPAAEKLDVQFQNPKPGINFIAKDDVNQSNITLVAMGTKRNDPDYYAIRVMNDLFGGGDSGRLYNNIRTKKGLAYSVGGGIGANYDYPGLFRISMGTKSETTAEAVNALFDEIERLDKEPPTIAEVTKAKSSLLNSFIFNFDSKVKVLSEKMAYEFYGYPQDFIDKFRPGIEKVTPADVSSVVKKFVDRKRFAVLVVGKAADFDKPLSTFGAVHTIDIAIPAEPPSGAGKAASKTIETNAAGKALIAKVAQALGGEAKFSALKSLSQSASQMIKTPQGDLTVESSETTVYPDSTHAVMQTPMGEMVIVVTPTTAFRAMGSRSQVLPESMKEEQLRDMKRDMVSILQHINDPNYRFNAGEKAGDDWTLDIDANGAGIRWFVDESGKILKSSFKTTSQAGPVQREIEYSDYRAVDGITLPFKSVTKDNGAVAAEAKVKEIKLNPPVDPKIFVKP